VQSIRVASGYSEGESQSDHTFELRIGLAIAAAMLLLILAQLGRAPERRSRALLGLAFAFALFVAFKTGFVRIADHTVFFFGWAAVAVFFVPPPRSHADWVSAACGLARHACVALALYGTAVGFNLTAGGLAGMCAASIDRALGNAQGLLDPSPIRDRGETNEASAAAANRLPKVCHEVGREPIDMMSFEQGLIFLNGLEWRPRPVFQSYVTFTPELLRANAEFFESERAPRYVLSKLETIDERLATMDDGLALQVVARNYRPVLVESDVVLLRRDPSIRKSEPPRVVARRTCKFGERVDLAALEGGSHVLKLDVRYSLWGRLRTMIHNAPPLWMSVQTAEGGVPPVRIVPGMMRSGALVDPWIDTQDRWIDWLSQSAHLRVSSFAIDVPESPAMYADSIDVEILDADPAAPLPGGAHLQLLDAPIFDPAPSEVQTTVPARERRVESKGVLLVQTPSRLRFDIAPGSYVVSGVFGLLPEAYEMHASDGASFVALLDEGGKRQVMFTRMLDPVHRARDRGSQPLLFDLTTQQPAALYLYANPGWNNDSSFDLAYWGALRIASKDTR
jgi:hypothetical protein